MKYAVIGDKGMFGAEMFLLLSHQGINVKGFNRANLDLEILTVEELALQLEGFQVVDNF
jgi:dTDP-4-dehydrorhamnose reductase